MLLTCDIKPSTQIQTLNDFQHHFVDKGLIPVPENNIKEYVLRINKNEPTETFAVTYRSDAKKFLEDVFALRNNENETLVKS
jgi:sulfite reductase (ferredoxin)